MKRPTKLEGRVNKSLTNVQNYNYKKGYNDCVEAFNKSDPTEEEILNIIEGELMKELSNEVITCERFEYPIFKKISKEIYKRIKGE